GGARDQDRAGPVRDERCVGGEDLLSAGVRERRWIPGGTRAYGADLDRASDFQGPDADRIAPRSSRAKSQRLMERSSSTSDLTGGQSHWDEKKALSARAGSCGCSSGKKWPPLTGWPVTSAASSRQISSGPPLSTYQDPRGPAPLQSASTGHAIRRPPGRSARSCSRSMPAAARYSSQIAWRWSGFCSCARYCARVSSSN